MNWALVITVNNIPKLSQSITQEGFARQRTAFQKLGTVISLNEYNVFGFTDNEGRAVCYHLVERKEERRAA